MGVLDRKSPYIYTFAYHEDEAELCRLEMRTLFGQDPYDSRFIESACSVDPSRSPFMKYRIDVLYEASELGQLAERAACTELEGATFKVLFVETDSLITYEEKRSIEREIGFRIRGKAEMRKPERLFGVAKLGGRWVFGRCSISESVWLRHQAKPRNYSTALGTRVARAVANIAVPEPYGIRAVDPCCGIGTVLIEALSMGIQMVGRDLNPLAVKGARENLAHFGFPNNLVTLGNLCDIQERYEAAVIDMPYNLCSKCTDEEQLSMLKSARRFADKVVIISTESIESHIKNAGFRIEDECVIRKGNFARYIWVCL